MSALFSSFQSRGLSLHNRVVIAPMCQYSAIDGVPQDWHLIHLGGLALGGPGLVIVEATGVEPEGRITPACTGLWSDACEEGFARVLAGVRRYRPTPLGIQLAHAGRKASCAVPWEGGRWLAPDAGGYERFAPSAVSFNAEEPPPTALDAAGLARVVRAFTDATVRASRLGFDLVEVHAAHGYLLHQFLSPLSNHRHDAYGGSLANRMRFPLEVIEAVRAAWPADRPLCVRVSATDWVDGGWDLDSTVAFAKALGARGVDLVHVSSGGLSPAQQIAAGPGFQIPFATRVRAESGLPVIGVGMVTEPHQAEEIVARGRADLVAIARASLYDPRWVWHAAAALGDVALAPPQALRGAPRSGILRGVGG